MSRGSFESFFKVIFSIAKRKLTIGLRAHMMSYAFDRIWKSGKVHFIYVMTRPIYEILSFVIEAKIFHWKDGGQKALQAVGH